MHGNREKNLKTLVGRSVTGLDKFDNKIRASRKKTYLNLLHIKQCKVHTRTSGIFLNFNYFIHLVYCEIFRNLDTQIFAVSTIRKIKLPLMNEHMK